MKARSASLFTPHTWPVIAISCPNEELPGFDGSPCEESPPTFEVLACSKSPAFNKSITQLQSQDPQLLQKLQNGNLAAGEVV